MLDSLCFGMTSEMARSVTYFQWPDSNVFSRQLTITKNKMGPNFVPWGTPAFTCAHLEIDSPSLTFCLRSDKKSHNHGIVEQRCPMSIHQHHVWITRNETCQVGIEQ